MAEQMIGARMKALRQERGLSQDGMAHVFGFKDRQTVSAIETGVRRVSATELLQAAEKFQVPLDYFTDPFRVAGEIRFSWRQSGVGPSELATYERTAGSWVGAYRTLSAQIGKRSPLMRRALGLTKAAKLNDAVDAGERFTSEFELGKVPAHRLAGVMQEQLGILVLMVDAYQGISGAACRLPELDAVLIARREVAGRRNFDLAHEFFHILTWEAMPPAHVEEPVDSGGNRIEQLANSFASALLMPKEVVESLADWRRLEGDNLIAHLNATADELSVTSSALRWRLVTLGHLTNAIARALPEALLRNNGRKQSEETLPLLFSRSYAEVVATAIKRGYLSVRRAARLVGMTIEGLDELFTAHGLKYALAL
ncbi:MAG: XRE family transcriptional regulator [Gammaproteobacteria bacterium]|nr:XRE family transcriptional regulator [Gammaproteobacteria bacterium]